VFADAGVPKCHELKTGKDIWDSQIEKRPGSTAWGSPVLSADKLYITDRHGTTYVFAAGPKYELLATNPLKEQTEASIAVYNGELFIRTHKHLWCISEKK